MAQQEAVKVTKKQIDDAEKMWQNFVTGGKYSIYATVIILVLLAVGFVDFSSVNHGH
ncbi:MAG: hypothetical protein ACRBDI_07640 [Alphaproteobacteria bacterium]